MSDLNNLPTEMTVGGRTYEILAFLRDGETWVLGCEMITRVKDLNAHLGKKEGEYILKHQGQIPASLRGMMVFVFTDWRHPTYLGCVACVCWRHGRWIRYWSWGWDNDKWPGCGRVLRRKK